jgi:hypothetical protein
MQKKIVVGLNKQHPSPTTLTICLLSVAARARAQILMSHTSSPTLTRIYRRIRRRFEWPLPLNTHCPFCLDRVGGDDDVFTYVGRHGAYAAHVHELSAYILSSGSVACPLTREPLSVLDVIRLDRAYARHLRQTRTIAATSLVACVYHPRWVAFRRAARVHADACDAFTCDVHAYVDGVTAQVTSTSERPPPTTHDVVAEWPDLTRRVRAFHDGVDAAHAVRTLQDGVDAWTRQQRDTVVPSPKILMCVHLFASLLDDAHVVRQRNPHDVARSPAAPKLELYSGDAPPSTSTLRAWMARLLPPPSSPSPSPPNSTSDERRDRRRRRRRRTRTRARGGLETGMSMAEVAATTIATHAWRYVNGYEGASGDVPNGDGTCGDVVANGGVGACGDVPNGDSRQSGHVTDDSSNCASGDDDDDVVAGSSGDGDDGDGDDGDDSVGSGQTHRSAACTATATPE